MVAVAAAVAAAAVAVVAAAVAKGGANSTSRLAPAAAIGLLTSDVRPKEMPYASGGHSLS